MNEEDLQVFVDKYSRVHLVSKSCDATCDTILPGSDLKCEMKVEYCIQTIGHSAIFKCLSHFVEFGIGLGNVNALTSTFDNASILAISWMHKGRYIPEELVFAIGRSYRRYFNCVIGGVIQCPKLLNFIGITQMTALEGIVMFYRRVCKVAKSAIYTILLSQSLLCYDVRVLIGRLMWKDRIAWMIHVTKPRHDLWREPT